MRSPLVSVNWPRGSVNWPRVALGPVIAAALVALGGGSAWAAAGVAASRVAASPATPACTVIWVGKASEPLWTDGSNWSTGKVPGPASDVCITATGDDVLTSVSISIHSLLLGPIQGIAMEGTSSKPLTMTVATSVVLSPGGISRIDLTDATINAAQINDRGGTIFTDGTCNLTSPDIVFGDGGNVQAANGTTALSSLPQLSGGTLSGASFSTSDATVLLPGDITHLVDANIGVGADSAIEDAAGHNALTGLTSIDSQSSLLVATGLSLTGSLVADGNVTFEGGNLTVAGTLTQAGGTLDLGVDTKLSASQALIEPGAFLDIGAAFPATIEGNLVNEGRVTAGGNSRVTGNYTQAASGNLFSGFTGTLHVAGKATLAGTVTSRDPFAVPGQTSPVITFGSRSGDFTSVSLGFILVTTADSVEAIATPQIAVTPTTAAPGEAVTVNGASFKFGTTVKIFLDRTSGTPLATVSASYGGAFSDDQVTIPGKTKAGSHTLIAVGVNGSQATAAITVS
jgi:hypothetical protein